MNIAIDVDEVLADFIEAYIAYHNQRFKTNLTSKEFYSYDFWEITGFTKEDTVRVVHDFYKTEEFKSLPVMPDSVEGIDILKKNGHILYAITSRPLSLQEITSDWLENNFPKQFTSLHSTGGYVGPQKTSKLEIALQLNCSHAIEDAPKFALQLAKGNIQVLLYNHPWNQNLKEDDDIIRVNNWEEIIDYFFIAKYFI